MHASLMNLYVRLSYKVSDFPVSQSQIFEHNVMNFKTVLTFPLTRIKSSTHKTRSFLFENSKLFLASSQIAWLDTQTLPLFVIHQTKTLVALISNSERSLRTFSFVSKMKAFVVNSSLPSTRKIPFYSLKCSLHNNEKWIWLRLKRHCRHVFTLCNYPQSHFTARKFSIVLHASHNLSEIVLFERVLLTPAV